MKQLCTDLKSTLNCLSGGEQQKIPNHLLTHARLAMIVVRRTGKSCLLDLGRRNPSCSTVKSTCIRPIKITESVVDQFCYNLCIDNLLSPSLLSVYQRSFSRATVNSRWVAPQNRPFGWWQCVQHYYVKTKYSIHVIVLTYSINTI